MNYNYRGEKNICLFFYAHEPGSDQERNPLAEKNW